MLSSFDNPRASVMRLRATALVLSLFVVLLAPLSAFAAAPKDHPNTHQENHDGTTETD